MFNILDTTYISPMLLPVSTGQMYLLNCDIFHVHCLSSRYSIVSNIRDDFGIIAVILNAFDALIDMRV